MKCPNCHKDTSRVWGGMVGWECDQCCTIYKKRVKIDGILTRNSPRIKQEREKYAKDLIQPEVYDKSSKKLKINPDFAKYYPDKVKNFFTPEQIRKQGFSK